MTLVFALLLGQLSQVQEIGWQLYDLGLGLRESEDFKDVVLVGVTNDDVAWLEQPFPWPRDQQSVIFEKIAAQEPRTVAVDFLYTEPSPPEADLRLGRELAATGNSVGAYYFDEGNTVPPTEGEEEILKASGNLLGADLTNRRWPKSAALPKLPTPNIADGFSRVGHAMSVPDSDGITRRLPLLVSDGNRLYPALALQGVLLHWGVEWSQIRATPWEISIVGVPEIGNVTIPLDGRGRFLLPLPTDTDSRFAGVSVKQLVAMGEAPPMKDKLVFVGSLLTGHGDIYPTSVEPATAGLMINAAAAGLILRREFIIASSGWGVALLTMVVLAITVAMGSLNKPVLALLLSGLLAAGVVGGALWLLMEHLIWISPVSAVTACVVAAVAMTTVNFATVDRQRKETLKLLSRYLSPKLAAALAADPDALNRPPRREVLSVFFSDIVAYTDTSERLEAEDLISVLNQYYGKMTEVAHRHDGTVNKYLGDGMMVFFNDPFGQEDHALRAVKMAVDMQLALGLLNPELEKQGLPFLEVRMGISSGHATVGNLGSEGFTDYTAIGPTVNLAARIMNLAGGRQIYVSEKTMLKIPAGEFEFEDLGPQTVKGVAEPVNVSSVNLHS